MNSNHTNNHKRSISEVEINEEDEDKFLQDNIDQLDHIENRLKACDNIKPLFTTDTKKKVACHLMCHLCNDILCYPCYMVCCKQRFCKSCLGKFWETSNKVCPSPGCKKQVKQKLADIPIDRDIHEICVTLFPDRVQARLSGVYDTLSDSEKKICIMRMITSNIESKLDNPMCMKDYITKLDYYLGLADIGNVVRCGCNFIMIPAISIKQGNWYIGCPMYMIDKKNTCNQYYNIPDISIFFKDDESLKIYNNKLTNRSTMFPFKKQKTSSTSQIPIIHSAKKN